MYQQFFKLKEMPFALTPDPRFMYFTPSHIEAMANLRYGIESGKGLIAVTGEVGTGKTTILRWMMRRLDSMVLVAYIFNPRLSVSEFYQHLATLLGCEGWQNKSELLLTLGRKLEARHRGGLRTVLIVDEAQGLSINVLEEIRLLLNFETDTGKQLQVVLSGQPELRDVLRDPRLRQLKQRIALRCDISALPDVEQTACYITSRLLVAGAERTDIFTPGAIDFIFRCSEGIPRQINNLCDNALLAGYAAGEQTISTKIIEEVAQTFDLLPPSGQERSSSEQQQQRSLPASAFSSEDDSSAWEAAQRESEFQTHGPRGAGRTRRG
ncbi:MAG: AAA family ATPase [Pyrinomonadaceae bacterium]